MIKQTFKFRFFDGSSKRRPWWWLIGGGWLAWAHAVAQPASAPDFVVLLTGDTLYGTVAHHKASQTSPGSRKKIKLTPAQGRSRHLRRSHVRAFRAEGQLYERFVLRPSSGPFQLVHSRYEVVSSRGEAHFLKLVASGALSHYQLEWWEQGEAAPFAMDLFKKTDDDYLVRATQGLLGLKRKVLAGYFDDCPDLQRQIEMKQINELPLIVDFYNRRCLR